MTTWGPLRVRLTAVFATAIAVVIVLIGAVHLPPIRAIVLRQAISLARASGVELTVADLDYNLLTLDVRLRGVSIRAVGAPAPFATADAIRIGLPASVLTGRFGTEYIDAEALAVRLIRSADGRLNLPVSSGEGGTIDRVDVGRVGIRGASLEYVDAANDVRFAASDVTLELPAPSNPTGSGRLSARNGVSLRAGDLVVSGTLDGQLAYNGISITMSELAIDSSMASVRLDGRLDVFGSEPSLELTARASARLDVLSTEFALESAAARHARPRPAR